MTSTANQFSYLIDKIEASAFSHDPFKFILIENFLSDEHFNLITSAVEINRPPISSTEKLIDDLIDNGYQVQTFPGCTNSIEEYLASYNSRQWDVDKELLEGFGITFRLKDYKTPLLRNLIEFLNTPEFKSALEKKFEISEPNYIETAYQKYLHGYEISPHPDVRKKAATYMLNINTDSNSENIDIHTHLLKFKNDKKYIYDFWKNNEDIERCWVPWDWCETIFETRANNSIVIFAPSNDTLHAVKLNYDHLLFQRTQVYGNLWYNEDKVKYPSKYPDIANPEIDIAKIKQKQKKQTTIGTIKSYIPDSIKNKLKLLLFR